MSVRGPLALSASVFALAAASPAMAQNFYVGLGLEGSIDTQMSDAVGSDFDSELTMGSVIGGVRLNHNNFFFGAEGETSLFAEYDSDFSTADLDRVSRLRAIGGYDFGSISGFAAVGGAWVEGELAGPGLDDPADGWTYGIGGEYTINDRFDIRVEAIHDDVEFEDGTYSWENTSLRAGAIVKF
jgi:opacity protein-like surface antigen